MAPFRTRRRLTLAALATSLLLVPGVLAGVDAPTGAASAFDAAADAALRPHLRDHELLVLEPHLFRAQLATGAADLTLRGRTYHLLVEPAPWDANLKVAVPQEDGSFAYVAPAFTAVAYLGRVAGEPGSFVHVVVTGAGVSAQVTTEAEDFTLEPLGFLVPFAPAGVSVAYRAQDVILPPEYSHGDGDLDEELPLAPPGGGLGAASYAPGPYRSITLWADEEMRATWNWENRIRDMMSSVNANYLQMVGFRLNVVNNAIYPCSASQCVTTGDALLGEFRDAVNVQGQPWSGYELAHLFTGKAIVQLGSAYMPGRYGMTAPRSSERVNALVMAHEVGHNFGGRHARSFTYTHMHGGTPYTHHTIMKTPMMDNQDTGGTTEVRWEFSSSNTNWIRACNLQSWSVTGFGDRCWSNERNFQNGGTAGGYDATNYRGKYFAWTTRGLLEDVCVHVDQAGYAVLEFKPLPTGAAPLFNVVVEATGAGRACAEANEVWNHDTMFVYKASGNARIGSDAQVTHDSYASSDFGATWQPEQVRRGFEVTIVENVIPVDGCGVLASGVSLGRDQRIRSCDGRFDLVHQMDGNVVVYQGTQVRWATHTVGQATTSLVMQGDGNLVLYNGPSVVWASGTAANPGAWLSLRDDGIVTIYARDATTLWYAGCGVLTLDATILRGTELRSCDRRFYLAHQFDGNVVLYQNGVPLWATNTMGYATTALKMQSDGNLVLYNGGSPVWASHTAGNPRSRLFLQDDGDLVIRTSYNQAIWWTGTGGR